MVSFLMLVAAGGVMIVALLLVSAVEVAQASWFGVMLARFQWLGALQSLAFTYSATILFILGGRADLLFHPQRKDPLSRRLGGRRAHGHSLATRLRRLLVVHRTERPDAHTRVDRGGGCILTVDLRVLGHPYVRSGIHSGVRAHAAATSRRNARRANPAHMTRSAQASGPGLVVATICLSVATAGAQFTLVSVEQEIEIGQQANAQVRREVPELRDAQVIAYIRGIGQRLARQASGPKYPYSFSVADYREINAFALPGGPVWIHRGVMHAATNESQVAGVLAHEIAHIAQRHAADQLTKGHDGQSRTWAARRGAGQQRRRERGADGGRLSGQRHFHEVQPRRRARGGPGGAAD